MGWPVVWIQHDVARKFQKVGIPLYQDGLVSTLEEVTDQSMASVRRLGVDAVELAHPLDLREVLYSAAISEGAPHTERRDPAPLIPRTQSGPR